MEEQTQGLIDRVNLLVQSDVLRPKAKAFLLLKLCQLYALFSSEKAQSYWERLTPFKSVIPVNEKSHLEELNLVFEEIKAPGGFAGKMIEEIKAKLKNPNILVLELRDFLNAKEEEIKKKFLLSGKQAIYQQLVLAWKTIDRKQALTLTAKLSAPVRQMIVRRMNQEKPLSIEEWYSFIAANSQQEAAKIILTILEDSKPEFEIPNDLVVPVVTAINNKLVSMNEFAQVLDLIDKFVRLVAKAENFQNVFDALKFSARNFATTGVLANNWLARYEAILRLIFLGVSSGLITVENMALLIKDLPKHMTDFCMASCYAILADENNAAQYLTELINKAAKKEEAETLFLVLLVERSLGDLAYTLASKSPRKLQVLPHIHRALLSNYSQTSADKIPPSEIENDPVAQLLKRAPGRERVEYLREITNNGTQSLPGALWALREQQVDKKGFIGSLFSSGKSLDEIINEYLARNPLYSSFRTDTPPDKQFTEFLRNRGEYRYQMVDQMLLNTLVLWADENPNEVKSSLRNMWQAIQPEIDLLKVDFLRNAIFNRCTTVFAADPDVLVQDFLSWLKQTLIDKSLTWEVNRTQFTVNYPRTALASMCIQSALAVQKISPARRDRLVEIALTRFQSTDELADVGAQLYNNSKEALDLKLPWKIASKVEDGWQLGIVKNAIPAIINAVIQMETPAA